MRQRAAASFAVWGRGGAVQSSVEDLETAAVGRLVCSPSWFRPENEEAVEEEEEEEGRSDQLVWTMLAGPAEDGSSQHVCVELRLCVALLCCPIHTAVCPTLISHPIPSTIVHVPTKTRPTPRTSSSSLLSNLSTRLSHTHPSRAPATACSLSPAIFHPIRLLLDYFP